MEVDPFNKTNNLEYSQQQNNNHNNPPNTKKYAEIDFNKDAITTRVNFNEKIENNDTDASSLKNKSFDSGSQKSQSSDELTEKHNFPKTPAKVDSTQAEPTTPEKKNIYRSREQSRFSFVEDKKEGESIKVPEFINKFIQTKFAGHSFFSKFSTNYDLDLICLDTKLEDPNNTWTEFLLSNKKSIAS